MNDTSRPSATVRGELTRREREVIALVAEGLTNAEIALRLVISSGTVANHTASIQRRLGMRNRVQLAVWAVEHGLFSSGEPIHADRALPGAVTVPEPDPDDTPSFLCQELQPAEWTAAWRRLLAAQRPRH